MADHFMETVNLRFAAIEQRLDSEVAAVQEHFAEQRLFTVAGYERVYQAVQAGFARTFDELAGEKDRSDALEQRMGRLEQRMDRLESKLDNFLTTALAALADIQRRLPP